MSVSYRELKSAIREMLAPTAEEDAQYAAAKAELAKIEASRESARHSRICMIKSILKRYKAIRAIDLNPMDRIRFMQDLRAVSNFNGANTDPTK